MDNILGQFLICYPFKRGTQRNRQISVFEILVSGNCSRNYFGLAFERVELQPCSRSSHEAVGSKQVIISKHIEMLMQLPKRNNSSDLKQLRQLLDKIEAAIRSLKESVYPIWGRLSCTGLRWRRTKEPLLFWLGLGNRVLLCSLCSFVLWTLIISDPVYETSAITWDIRNISQSRLS